MNKLAQKRQSIILYVRQRFGKLNWWFIGFIILATNLATLADGDFFNWKMNGGILLMIIMAAYMYDRNVA